MKRVFLVHRWSGQPLGDWRQWLKTELENMGYEVFAPEMPDREHPTIENWVSFLNEQVGEVDEDTYFVGHSIGVQTIMRYLAQTKKKCGGALFVAGWFNLENLEYADLEVVAQPWIDTPIDIDHLQLSMPKSTVFISDNDSYGCIDENNQKFGQLGSKIVLVHNAGHFTDVDGFTEFPLLLEEFNIIAE